MNRVESFRNAVQANLKTAIPEGFWENVHRQYEELKSAKSADDVVNILGGRNSELGPTSDAFFEGSGGDEQVYYALMEAGWKINWADADYYFAATAPDGSGITYVEGDIYRGIQQHVGARKQSDSLWPGSDRKPHPSQEWFKPTHTLTVYTDAGDTDIEVMRWEGTGGWVDGYDELYFEDSPMVEPGSLQKIESHKQASRDDLIAGADAAYNGYQSPDAFALADQAWFDALSEDDLIYLWNINPYGMYHGWDDEVYEALASKGFWDDEDHERRVKEHPSWGTVGLPTASRKTAEFSADASECSKCGAAISFDPDTNKWADEDNGSTTCAEGGKHSPISPDEHRDWELIGAKRKQGATLDSGPRDFFLDQLKAQIGMMNILAISGGRVEVHSNGIRLPVAYGYAVDIFLEADDTYTVETVFTRSGVTKVVNSVAGIYAEQVGESAYQASLFRDKPWEKGGAKTALGDKPGERTDWKFVDSLLIPDSAPFGVQPGFENARYKVYKYQAPGGDFGWEVVSGEDDLDSLAEGVGMKEAFELANAWNLEPWKAPDHSQFHDPSMFGLISSRKQGLSGLWRWEDDTLLGRPGRSNGDATAFEKGTGREIAYIQETADGTWEWGVFGPTDSQGHSYVSQGKDGVAATVEEAKKAAEFAGIEFPGSERLPFAANHRVADLDPTTVGVKVGDIFVATWGYDQTNVDFYEITGLTAASVRVRKLQKNYTESSAMSMAGKSVPLPGQYSSGEVTKRLLWSGYSNEPEIKVGYQTWATPWDGQPEYESHYATRKQAENLSEWVKRGYADFQAKTPWERAPEGSYEAWRAGEPESPESTAYWSGFDAAGNDAVFRAGSKGSAKVAYDPELAQLGDMFNQQFEDMKGKERADTLPCPEHKDKEATKGGTYASFPSSYTEYHCPEGHDFKVRVGTTREEILAEGSKTALGESWDEGYRDGVTDSRSGVSARTEFSDKSMNYEVGYESGYREDQASISLLPGESRVGDELVQGSKKTGFLTAIQRGVMRALALDPQSGHGDSSLPTVEEDTPDDEEMWPWEIGEIVEEVVEEVTEKKSSITNVWSNNGLDPFQALEDTNTDETMWEVELEDGDPASGEDAADVGDVSTPGQEVADYPQPIASRTASLSELVSELNAILAESRYGPIDEATAQRWASSWTYANFDEWQDATGRESMTADDAIAFAISNAGEIAEYFIDVELPDPELDKEDEGFFPMHGQAGPRTALTLDPDKQPDDQTPAFGWELPEDPGADPDLGQGAADVADVPVPGDALEGSYPQPNISQSQADSVNSELDDSLDVEDDVEEEESVGDDDDGDEDEEKKEGSRKTASEFSPTHNLMIAGAGGVLQYVPCTPLDHGGEFVTCLLEDGSKVKAYGGHLSPIYANKDAARSDYEHWNEEADAVWWAEEGSQAESDAQEDPDEFYEEEDLDYEGNLHRVGEWYDELGDGEDDSEDQKDEEEGESEGGGDAESEDSDEGSDDSGEDAPVESDESAPEGEKEEESDEESEPEEDEGDSEDEGEAESDDEDESDDEEKKEAFRARVQANLRHMERI